MNEYVCVNVCIYGYMTVHMMGTVYACGYVSMYVRLCVLQLHIIIHIHRTQEQDRRRT